MYIYPYVFICIEYACKVHLVAPLMWRAMRNAGNLFSAIFRERRDIKCTRASPFFFHRLVHFFSDNPVASVHVHKYMLYIFFLHDILKCYARDSNSTGKLELLYHAVNGTHTNIRGLIYLHICFAKLRTMFTDTCVWTDKNSTSYCLTASKIYRRHENLASATVAAYNVVNVIRFLLYI